jgi:hypothetical protein
MLKRTGKPAGRPGSTPFTLPKDPPPVDKEEPTGRSGLRMNSKIDALDGGA